MLFRSLAVPGRVPDLGLDHAVPMEQLVEAVLAGGTATVCTQCAARRGITADDLAPGVRIAGAATAVEESLREGAQALDSYPASPFHAVGDDERPRPQRVAAVSTPSGAEPGACGATSVRRSAEGSSAGTA